MFEGWVPTITGRLSFSRFGEHATGSSVVCNLSTEPTGYIFGVQKRTSRDGPLPAAIMEWLGRFPHTDYVIFLRICPGRLPYPEENCGDLATDETGMVLRPDDRSELFGEIYFINGHSRVCKSDTAEALDLIRILAEQAEADLNNGIPAAGGYFERAHARAVAHWQYLKSRALSGKKIPNFGKASVLLRRTGECRIYVEPEDLFTTEVMQLAQIAGKESDIWHECNDEFDYESESVSEQCFSTIRDLAHKHYHHRPESDLLTTVHKWTESTDINWRRETQYGLLRASILIRRDGRAESYRQTLGLIAYADAFQKHMCSWSMNDKNNIVQSLLRFDYDFSSFKSSVEASLKSREIADTNRKTRLIFIVATIFTTIGFMLPGLRAKDPQELSWPAELFMLVVNSAIENPIVSLLSAGLLALLIDIAVLGYSVQPDFIHGFSSSLSRYGHGLMADFRRHWRGQPTISQASALALIGLFISFAISFTVLIVGCGIYLMSLID